MPECDGRPRAPPSSYGVAHDLLHEPERDQVIAEIAAWISAHTPDEREATAATP